MHIPNLKRIKVSSPGALDTWLAKAPADLPQVMIVTCNKTSRTKFVSRDQVCAALQTHGWHAGQSYTLPGNLVGHVAHQANRS